MFLDQYVVKGLNDVYMYCICLLQHEGKVLKIMCDCSYPPTLLLFGNKNRIPSWNDVHKLFCSAPYHLSFHKLFCSAPHHLSFHKLFCSAPHHLSLHKLFCSAPHHFLHFYISFQPSFIYTLVCCTRTVIYVNKLFITYCIKILLKRRDEIWK